MGVEISDNYRWAAVTTEGSASLCPKRQRQSTLHSGHSSWDSVQLQVSGPAYPWQPYLVHQHSLNKAHQHLYFLRRLKAAGLGPPALVSAAGAGCLGLQRTPPTLHLDCLPLCHLEGGCVASGPEPLGWVRVCVFSLILLLFYLLIYIYIFYLFLFFHVWILEWQ